MSAATSRLLRSLRSLATTENNMPLRDLPFLEISTTYNAMNCTRIIRMSVRNSGWVPMYHGGWAMMIVPALVGIIHGQATWKSALFFVTWLVGYFFFYASTLYLRSHFKKRYLPPVATYGAISGIGALTLAITTPRALWWAPVFLILIAVEAFYAYRRTERAFLSGLITVTAACLGLPLAWSLTDNATPLDVPTHIWVFTLFAFLYFAGTIFYVKTNIREKKSNAYLTVSIAWHCLAFLSALAWMWIQPEAGTYLHAFTWLLAAARAILVPLLRRRGTAVPIPAIGIGEIVLSLLFFTAFLVC